MNHLMEMKKEFELFKAELDANPSARMLYQGTVSKALYVDFLIQSYHYVRYTQPFLARAAEVLITRGQDLELAHLFARKATEENAHELWLLDDLKALGISKAVVDRTPPTPAVNAYVSWNALMVEIAPIAFLSAAFMLEHLSSLAAEAARNLVKHSRIKHVRSARSFLEGHAEADVDHVLHLEHALELVTDPRDKQLLVLTAAVVRTAYVGMFPLPPGKTKVSFARSA